MQEIRYADAGMDMKKLGICFMQRCWIVLAAALAGAVIGSVVYTVAHTVPESEREYQAVSKIYLDFAADETGEVYQAYNGYTWNDLMATDPILDVTMEYLPEGYTREEVVAATKAEILSDLRLLTITITTHDAGRCDAIMQATEESLVNRGSTAKEFKNITVIQTEGAGLVTADNRMAQAALIGLVTAAVLTLFGMLLYYIMDDRILLAGDLKMVTDMSFIGYAKAGERLDRDYNDNLAYLREQMGVISTLPIVQKTTAHKGGGNDNGTLATQEKWKELCDADGVVIMVEYGKVHAAYLAYIIDQLKLRKCRVAGIAITGADERFLNRYYGRAIGRG